MNDSMVSGVFEEAVRPEERTLGVDLLVRRLADRFRKALDGDSAGLAWWLDEAIARYASLQSLEALVGATWRHTIASNGAHDVNAIQSLEQTIAASLRRPRESQRNGHVEQLDEIDACIGDLIGRLFDHDQITAEHSRAVSSWCTRIARKLGFSQEDVLLVKRGGLAHDVGKIGTPDEILNAPRHLTDAEWVIMRRHTVEGAEIVADIPLLADFLPAIRSHHERIDGNGYPDGLKGLAIPLSARVVAVADCFNAMIGRRPYRPPMEPYRALELLQRSAGTQLDGEIVEALVAVVTAPI